MALTVAQNWVFLIRDLTLLSFLNSLRSDINIPARLVMPNAELRGRPNRRNTAKQPRFGLSQ
ncbi:MAG: hypothetical protein CTY19_05310 [Methylomonas sp.]|nr:MAG: hypothetical protein CTY19_05310 [Methylomonas sp.]